MNKYIKHALCLGLVGLASAAVAQEVLCPSSGLPVSQDPGCWAREQETAAQQQQASQQSAQPPQPTGYWVKTWGAIAPSPKGGVLGAAVGADSKEDAEKLALVDCKAKGGGGCKMGLSYHNQCAVAIIGKNTFRMFGAPTIKDATEDGVKDCKAANKNNDCRVYYSACTEPRFVKY